MPVGRDAAGSYKLALRRIELSLTDEFKESEDRMHSVTGIAIEHLQKAFNVLDIHCVLHVCYSMFAYSRQGSRPLL
jgi:hypothetical protein